MQQPAFPDESVADGLRVLEALAEQEAVAFAVRPRQLARLVRLSERAYGSDGVESFLVLDVAGTFGSGRARRPTG